MRALSALAALVAALALSATSASASVNGFAGGDGNQACAAGEIDWACLGDIPLAHGADAGVVDDDVFKGGSKEVDPVGWIFETGSTNGKTDVRSVWSAPVETAAGSFLNLAFWRETGQGDAYFSFELNQNKTTWTNPAGAAVPCRTDGDVLVSYEIPSIVEMRLFSWTGSGGPASCPDGASGSWISAGNATSAAEGALNQTAIANTLSGGPAGQLADKVFGEASLDLSEVVADVAIAKPCQIFTSMQAHSRVSSSITSTLGDYVKPTPTGIAACRPPSGTGDTTAPDAPTLTADAGCHANRVVTLSGTAEPGSQVQVRWGVLTIGVADTGTDGTWTLAADNMPDGSYELVARARDAAANVSADSAKITVKVDATPPAAPVVTSHTATVAGVVISGTSAPGAELTVSENGSAVAFATAGPDGAWTAALPAQPAGKHTYAITAADACGNAGAPVTLVVDVPKATDPLTPGTGTTGGTVTTTPGVKPPQNAVLGERVDGCSSKAFFARINSKGLKRATFYIDGKKVAVDATADKQGRYAFRVSPKAYGEGTHKMKVVTTSKKGKKRTVPLRSFTTCGLGKCISRRGFKVRVKLVKGGDKVVKATVKVNGKQVKIVRGKRLRAPVELKGLPKGRFTVKITSTTMSGKTIIDTRKYKTCEGTSSGA